MERLHISYSAQQTEKLGFEFAKLLHPGDVVCLYGELGAGKTTFSQGVARGLGIKSRIISPTFSLVKQYQITDMSGQVRTDLKTFYHIDLYRLANLGEIKSIGIQEILDTRDGVILIEWPEKIESILPAQHISVKIIELDSGRDIQINFPNL